MTLLRVLFVLLIILVGESGGVSFLAQGLPGQPSHSLFDDVQIGIEPVAEGIFMLTGEGGNIGVSAGNDGVFLIDDQFAPLTDKIIESIATISSKPIKFLFNTHWHSDHTGGNENLGKAGVLIVAHDNVRIRMSTEQFQAYFNRVVLPSPDVALPVVTFSEAVTFHVNGEEIYAFQVPPAHTDGDSVIHFRKADVIHTGDLFTHGGYPFIGLSSGGTLDGMIRAANILLGIVGPETRIIPGHGPLAGLQELKNYRNMLRTIRDRVKGMVDDEKTVDEVIRAKPTEEFDASHQGGFLTPEEFTRLAYDSVNRD
jgi:cyclase